MRKVKEVLRLKYDCGLSEREIARSCQVARSTIARYLMKAEAAGISWPEAADQTEAQIDEHLFPVQTVSSSIQRPLPDCQYIYDQLRTYRRVNLTLSQLWIEYKIEQPDGYQYTQFCDYYRKWRGMLDYCMRQEHRGGEKVFIDYTEGLSFIDILSDEIIATQLFVAVWGASNFTFAESTLSQKLPDWTRSHVDAFDYFGCAPRVLVPDNLKSAVNQACRYEPELNPTYAEMAEHYGCAVLPARPYHARDKAPVEVGVLIAQRWILAVLRKRTFYSLAELNTAIRECLEHLNNRILRRAKKSRRELFETLDRPNALPLPQKPYEYAEWCQARVDINYHILIDEHFYSVPYQLLRQKLEVRLTATTIEAFQKGERVAAHARSYVKGGYTSLKEHMPSQHRAYAEWNPDRFIRWAGKIGEATAQLVTRVLASRSYPEQAYKACLGIINLARDYEKERVEAAAKRALQFNTCSFRSMKSILSAGLDRQPERGQQAGQLSLPFHQNIRGREYYQKENNNA
jgi:transposase